MREEELDHLKIKKKLNFKFLIFREKKSINIKLKNNGKKTVRESIENRIDLSI